MWFFEYDSPKYITITNRNNLTFGILNRLFQLAIIGYIIGYAIVWKKGYQDVDVAESAVTSKVKGVVYTNYSDDEFHHLVANTSLYRRIWDVADFVVPPMENGAFFVATNIIITPNQRHGKCPEDPKVAGALCKDSCPVGVPLLTGNGVTTGVCRPSAISNDTVCEVRAWCPVEVDTGPLKDNKPLLPQSEDFTVLIKNFIEFKKFHVKRRNIIQGSTDLKSCRYNPVNDSLCPIIRLGDIVDNLEDKTEKDTYEQLASQGGVIAIEINWDCNLDFSVTNCLPKYSFRRLDDAGTILAPGWNFRYANYFAGDVRTLYKVSGILFVIQVQGQAGKFNIVPLMMNVGAGIGLLAVATVLTDIIILYLSKDRRIYRTYKFEVVQSSDSEEHSPIVSPVAAGSPQTEVTTDGYQRMH